MPANIIFSPKDSPAFVESDRHTKAELQDLWRAEMGRIGVGRYGTTYEIIEVV